MACWPNGAARRGRPAFPPRERFSQRRCDALARRPALALVAPAAPLPLRPTPHPGAGADRRQAVELRAGAGGLVRGGADPDAGAAGARRAAALCPGGAHRRSEGPAAPAGGAPWPGVHDRAAHRLGPGAQAARARHGPGFPECPGVGVAEAVEFPAAAAAHLAGVSRLPHPGAAQRWGTPRGPARLAAPGSFGPGTGHLPGDRLLRSGQRQPAAHRCPGGDSAGAAGGVRSRSHAAAVPCPRAGR